MDKATDKKYNTYSYTSRYTSFPYYYHAEDNKYFYGITGHINKNISYVSHKVKDYDTLDSLAYSYYGRPDFYWIIADFNNIQDPYIKLKDKFTAIKIPTLTAIYYGETR